MGKRRHTCLAIRDSVPTNVHLGVKPSLEARSPRNRSQGRFHGARMGEILGVAGPRPIEVHVTGDEEDDVSDPLLGFLCRALP